MHCFTFFRNPKSWSIMVESKRKSALFCTLIRWQHRKILSELQLMIQNQASCRVLIDQLLTVLCNCQSRYRLLSGLLCQNVFKSLRSKHQPWKEERMVLKRWLTPGKNALKWHRNLLRLKNISTWCSYFPCRVLINIWGRNVWFLLNAKRGNFGRHQFSLSSILATENRMETGSLVVVPVNGNHNYARSPRNTMSFLLN